MRSLWKAYHTKIVQLSALFLTLLFSLASLVSCNQPPPPYASIKLGIPAAALQSPVKGPLPDSTQLNVGITFKIDPQLLSQADQQKLKPGQNSNLQALANRLGIDDATYQKIKQFFNPQGIVLSLSKLRTHLSIRSKAGTLAKVFQTKFVIHQYKGRTFYAPATPPKVLTTFASTIDAITGLDDYSKRPVHAMHITYPQGSHVSRQGTPDCSPDGSTLIPGDVATSYGYTSLYQHGLHGENMTINLVETDGSYSDDIQNYLSCIHFKGQLSFINVDGAPSGAEGESTLDVQMVAGLTPAASIKVYQTDGNADGDTWTQVNDELQRIINANTNNANAGSVVSISLGIDEADITSDDVRALDSSLQQLTQVEHMTVFVASGDCAAFADETFGSLSVSFPAGDPWAVAVGGTKLSVDSQGNRTNEVAWSQFPNIFHCNNSWGTGGGNSSLFSRPNWQNANGVNNSHSQNDRQLPDLAAVADNLAVYFQGQWGAVGGTSAAAPIWAAGQALVNEDTIQTLDTFGYSPRFYYAVADKNSGAHAYYDVTSGNNVYYHATPGWDYTTGLGTPNLASFVQVASNVLV
ncbi:MAG TPA: S53 family peptidase [Ktedonobacteraceae bacterium]